MNKESDYFLKSIYSIQKRTEKEKKTKEAQKRQNEINIRPFKHMRNFTHSEGVQEHNLHSLTTVQLI